MFKRKSAAPAIKDMPAGGAKSLAIALAVQNSTRAKQASRSEPVPSLSALKAAPIQEEIVEFEPSSKEQDPLDELDLMDIPEVDSMDGDQDDIVSRIRQRLNSRRGF